MPPPGIPVFSGPKINLENCLPHPCMEKNAIAHLVTKLDVLFETQLFYPKILDFMQKHYSVSTIVHINLQ